MPRKPQKTTKKKPRQEAQTSDLSPSAREWHERVERYLERRIEDADAREDDIEISYLHTCLLALTICEQLGIGLEPPAD
jgi:hypothetical protein